MRSNAKMTLQTTFFSLLSFLFLGTMPTNDNKTATNVVTTEADNSGAKKLVNTAWKIKFVDCVACNDRVSDIQFQDLGKGLVKDKPMRWSLRNDTVSIRMEAELCNFDKLYLAEENLMYGAYACKGAPASKAFTARKKDEKGNVIESEPKNNALALGAAAKTNDEAAATTTTGLNFIDKTYMFKRGIDKHYGERRIDAIILHSSFCVNSKNDFDVYCVLGEYKRHSVAAHYLIDREGKIHRLVRENDIAFHAGFGKMPDGNNHINTRSIGIELINSEDVPPNEEQYAALANLVRDIKSRHRIKYIKGHNQICPDRKSDPWRFSWKKFYELVNVE
jgi:N-acetylmuramoyl-L-alanine amidase